VYPSTWDRPFVAQNEHAKEELAKKGKAVVQELCMAINWLWISKGD
jgi:predicted CoA-binding protein